MIAGGTRTPHEPPSLGCRPPFADNSPPDCFPGAPGPRPGPAESQDEIRERISKLFSLGMTFAARYENHKVIFHHSPAKPLNDDYRRGCAPQFAMVVQVTVVPCTFLLTGPPPRFRLRRMPHRGTAQLWPPLHSPHRQRLSLFYWQDRCAAVCFEPVFSCNTCPVNSNRPFCPDGDRLPGLLTRRVGPDILRAWMRGGLKYREDRF